MINWCSLLSSSYFLWINLFMVSEPETEQLDVFVTLNAILLPDVQASNSFYQTNLEPIDLDLNDDLH